MTTRPLFIHLLVFAACLCGCAGDEYPEETVNEVLCTIDLQAESGVQIDTRAVDENTVSEVWIVQLAQDGSEALTTPVHATPTAGNKVQVRLKKQACKLYFFANTGNNALFDLSAAPGTLTASVVEGKQMTLAPGGHWGSLSVMPMYATWSGTPAAQLGPVKLTRCLAKVQINISNSTGGKLSISSMRLKAVPNVLKYSPTSTEPYPQATGTYLDYAATLANSATYFMAENCRGKGSERSELEKRGQSVADGTYATHYEIIGKYSGVDVTYRFYLGENNTNDYNVRRNTSYTMNITIKGKNPADTRVTIEATPLLISTGSGTTWGDGSTSTVVGGDRI